MVAAMVALSTTQFVQGHLADSYPLAIRALDLLGPDSELGGPAHFVVGASAVSLGKPAEGLRHFELAAKLANPAVALSVGTRPDVHGTAYAAHAHWLLGHGPEALAASQTAIALARAGGGPYNLAMALAYAAVTCQMRHDRPGPAPARAGPGRLYGRTGRRTWHAGGGRRRPRRDGSGTCAGAGPGSTSKPMSRRSSRCAADAERPADAEAARGR
jgi:hypothetical protein